jgi:hypothetical protein
MKKHSSKRLVTYTPILIFPDAGKTNPVGSKIVYTDLKSDSAILKSPNNSFNLDLNNDGIVDFEFNYTSSACGDGLIAPEVSYTYLSIEPTSGDNMNMATNSSITSGLNLEPVLDSSTAIAPDSLWVNRSQYMLYGAAREGYIRCMVVHGYWLNVSDKYIGLKFAIGNSTYYGWARLSSSYAATAAPYRHLTNGQLILKDYAYNSVPNQPILAGQTE